ncbi:hypothetical protein PR202_gb01110 [Eleusine coracana subsp. coracana]|uniref:Uncharacterized protein n=1 Tax=Eleusine coracana subsp. coracana TaxID=191504 RepID=A0AAV5DWL8_ELECO|nr:hypothetical protein PR202_gb01110 [Eleusine coracana subsp. coracana]
MAESAAPAAVGGAAYLAIKEVSFLCGVPDQARLSVEAAGTRCSVRRVRAAAYEAENIIDVADCRVKRNSRRKGMLGAISRYAHKPMDLLVARHKLGKDILHFSSGGGRSRTSNLAQSFLMPSSCMPLVPPCRSRQRRSHCWT